MLIGMLQATLTNLVALSIDHFEVIERKIIYGFKIKLVIVQTKLQIV